MPGGVAHGRDDGCQHRQIFLNQPDVRKRVEAQLAVLAEYAKLSAECRRQFQIRPPNVNHPKPRAKRSLVLDHVLCGERLASARLRHHHPIGVAVGRGEYVVGRGFAASRDVQ